MLFVYTAYVDFFSLVKIFCEPNECSSDILRPEAVACVVSTQFGFRLLFQLGYLLTHA